MSKKEQLEEEKTLKIESNPAPADDDSDHLSEAWLITTTSMHENAGNASSRYAFVYDYGKKTIEVPLDNPSRNDMERGQVDIFELTNALQGKRIRKKSKTNVSRSPGVKVAGSTIT